MRILLFGEYSGLHSNLKEGLIELGHDVTVVSSGEGWKNIKGDLNYSTNKKGLLGNIDKLFKLLRILPKLKNYDVVQLIAPTIVSSQVLINKLIINYLVRNNKKLFLVGAGAINYNSVIADFMQNNKYPEFYDEEIKLRKVLWSQTKKGRKYNKWFLNKINGYIPIMYEYAQGYRDIKYSKLCPTIALPINIDKIKYQKNIVEDKILIFHGLNREGVKGSPLIIDAMERLQKNYPSKVECIVDGKMPLEIYLRFLEKVNVVVDQVYSYSLGMNGIYNLAMGKIVVGGGEPEFLKEYGIDCSPLVSIQANIDDIYNQLEKLVLKDRQEIFEVGRESREFAESVYNYIKIAKQYIDVWQKY